MIKRQSRHVFLMSSAADNGCSAPPAVIKCTIGVVIELVTSEQLQTDGHQDAPRLNSTLRKQLLIANPVYG